MNNFCSNCGVPVTAHRYPFCPPDVQTALDKALPMRFGRDGSPQAGKLDPSLPIILTPGMMYEVNGYLIINKRPLEDTATRVYVRGDSILIKSDQPVEISVKRMG